jgi:hypothetical protein
MKNKIINLNDHLFETLERLNDEDLKGEELTAEINRAKAVSDIATTIISNADLMLKAQKQYKEYGITPPSTILQIGDGEC